jgi:DNA modification methylase
MTTPKQDTALNGICPYFTMFPLEFPYGILHRHARNGECVLDPFCGRGTTNFASRLVGLYSIGIDISPVAVALSQAKLANTTTEHIIQAAEQILDEVKAPRDVPAGEFWEWAFHPSVLLIICRLREGLIQRCDTDDRKALRALLMGALHGPRGKTCQSYFSNQCLRTYAPKPGYAVKYWCKHNLKPLDVDVLDIVAIRARRYFEGLHNVAMGRIIAGDSRSQATFNTLTSSQQYVDWVITSPPFYGMRTYLPDQWLQLWFVGGPPWVNYSAQGQLEHTSPHAFATQLRQVWLNIGAVCNSGARLIVRFGGINDRKADALTILKASFKESGWTIQTRRAAGSASKGRRQARHFANTSQSAQEEYDIWGRWEC